VNQRAGLPGALPGPSASGARLTGDDLQHLVAWYWALCSLRPEQAIISVAVEALQAGNVDDVVVTRRVGPAEHYQVKATVAAREMVNSAWLLAPTRRDGPSILQKFWKSWNRLRAGGQHVQMSLLTSRPLDVTDPVLQGRDRNDHLAAALRRAPGRSSAGQARRAWAEYLGTSEEELCRFLDHLRVRTDASEATWRQHVTDVSEGLGLRTDEPAIRLGIGEVREWVKQTRLARTPQDIADAIQRLGLQAADPKAVLLIQALEHEPVVGDVTIELDWVEHFSGEEPRTRRGLRQPEAWDSVLLPQLQAAVRTIRESGYHHVLVRGQMRLPCWFAAGAQLSEVAGFEVTSLQLGVLWSSLDVSHGLDQPPIILHDAVTGTGADLAVAIAIATDPPPMSRPTWESSLASVGTLRSPSPRSRPPDDHLKRPRHGHRRRDPRPGPEARLGTWRPKAAPIPRRPTWPCPATWTPLGPDASYAALRGSRRRQRLPTRLLDPQLSFDRTSRSRSGHIRWPRHRYHKCKAGCCPSWLRYPAPPGAPLCARPTLC
jgi:SMODS-associated and fused to various effectors sensor domain